MTKAEKLWLQKLAQVVTSQTEALQAIAVDLATLKKRAVAADLAIDVLTARQSE